jgi:hypothetical protein
MFWKFSTDINDQGLIYNEWNGPSNMICFPDGFILIESNKEQGRDGWEWFDISPIPWPPEINIEP